MRKIIIDNSVRYIPKNEQTKETDVKPEKIKAGSIPRKQGEKFSKNNKKIVKDFTAGDLEYLNE